MRMMSTFIQVIINLGVDLTQFVDAKSFRLSSFYIF